MNKSNQNNGLFHEKFFLDDFSKSDLISLIDLYQKQQKILSETIPLLIKSNDLNHERINVFLEELGKESEVSIGLYAELAEKDSFGLISSYTAKETHLQEYPLYIRLHENPEMIVELLTYQGITIAKNDTGTKEKFYRIFGESISCNLTIYPIYATGTTYGFFVIASHENIALDPISASFFQTLALVYAQFFNRKRLIENNEKMLQDVEKANQIKTAFLTNISNEIRTPVNAIVGFSDLLADPDLTIDQREEFINLITESSRTLVKMFDNIIDASKLRSKQVQFRKEWIDLGQLMLEVKSDLNYLHKNDEVIFEVLPPASDMNVQFFIDTYRLNKFRKT
jgi:hypothetical protein